MSKKERKDMTRIGYGYQVQIKDSSAGDLSTQEFINRYLHYRLPKKGRFLTTSEFCILSYIRVFKGKPFSIRETSSALKVSRNTVYRALKNLQEEQLISFKRKG